MMKRVKIFVLITMLALAMVSCVNSDVQPEETLGTTTASSAVTTTNNPQTTTTPATTTKESTTAAVTENPLDTFYEINWLVRYTENYEEGRWDELELEDKFNIDLKVWTIDAYNSEQINMMLAAGDYPDSGWIYYITPNQSYEQKLSRSVPLSSIKQNMPSYYALLEAVPIGFELNKIPHQTDEYYGLSYIYGMNNYWYNINGFRLDWLENIGFDIDDLVVFESTYFGEEYDESIYFSNRVIEYDELMEIYKSFTEDDPDGNGEDDTYGAVMLYPQHGAWSYITQGMFGYTPGSGYLYKDPMTGDYVPYYAYTGYRDFLNWAQDIIAKGYIIDLPGQEGWYNELNALWNAGKVGHMYMDALDTFDTAAGYYDSVVPYTLRQHTTDASIVVVPAVLGPDGKGGNSRYAPLPFRTGAWGTWMFGSQVDDGKLARILQLLEYTHFDTEAFYRYYYGIENIHFKWSGEKGKSSVIKIEQDIIPLKYRVGTTPQHIFATDKFLVDFRLWAQKHEFIYALSDFQLKNGWFDKYSIEPDKLCWDTYMGQDLYEKHTKLNNEYLAAINTVHNDFRNRVLKHQIGNINDEWSQYIQQLYSAGLQKLIDEIYNLEEFKEFIPYKLYELD